MTADPIERLQVAFGEVLAGRRSKRKLPVEAFIDGARLSTNELKGLEAGLYGPSLRDLIRIASVLGEEPLMFLVDVISAWRADPSDIGSPTRPHDFVRLFRLGYHHKPGDFRELQTSYYSVPDAIFDARRLNAQRHTRGVALLDTVCIYVRLDSVSLRSDGGQETL